MTYYGNRRWGKKKSIVDLDTTVDVPLDSREWSKITFKVPTALFLKLREIAEKNQMPMARLMAYALYNEIELTKPFNFNTEIPSEEEVPYVEGQFMNEAVRIYDLIVGSKVSLSRDTLFLSRHSLGMSRETLALAYREMLITGVVEEIESKMKNTELSHEYTTRIRLTATYRDNLEKQRKLRDDKLKEIYKNEHIAKYNQQKGPLDEA